MVSFGETPTKKYLYLCITVFEGCFPKKGEGLDQETVILI
jgi:hypothetical protein